MTTQTFTDVGIEIPYGRTGEVDVSCPSCTPNRKPEHRRNRDLSVNVGAGTWHCHHCGWSGSLNAGSKNGVVPTGAPLRPSERRVYAKPAPLPNPDDGLTPAVLAWFAKRGITETVVRRNRITAGPSWMPQTETEVNAIQFPYFRDGEIVNVKYRAFPKHFKMVKDAERVLYGLDDVAGADQATIVEGELDKLAVEVAGVPNCLSVPDGAPAPDAKNYEGKFTFLESAGDLFDRLHSVILATDSDAPGRKLAEELARRIGREKCYRVTWPDDCKDANDVLVKHGADEVRRCLADAQPYPIEGLVDHEALWVSLQRLYETGRTRGASTGWRALDPLYTVRPGQMSIVTGVPSSGKSKWLDSLMVNLARAHGWRFGVFSPENFPVEEHVAHLMSVYQGQPFDDGPRQRITREDLADGWAWISDHFDFLVPEAPRLDTILELARVVVFRGGIKGLVIDPWNEIDHSRPQGMTETEYISQCLTNIRQFARHRQVHVWVVAHPTKLVKLDDGAYPVVSPYDIAGSAHWFAKADVCLSIWRNRLDDHAPVDVHVQKVRFREIGQLGMAQLRYDPVTGRYRDL
jgi:twinkle protein